nr:non-ribosomal peptide synthetase [Pyxidicoccus caerfyrddinensis]
MAFDLSVEEVFTTLTSGATLVLAPLEKLMPGAPLHQLLHEQALTVISLTPAALAATPADGLPELRTVISGGEALPADVVARWAPGRRLLNTYGPTEATVIATLTECVADGRVPSIGRPLANARAYVLDPRGEPVPVGVKGELHLGGVGVARGYPGRPALTAERFVPDPFSGEAGARLYRTGDVVRWREDGTLDFVGRADAQVKVRGFRIELGEVESALAKLPPVREAVVVAREDGPGGKRLVGYVVAREGADTDGATLRTALKQTLPEYMVPTAVVLLPELPLTPNGKVDRKALPAPDFASDAKDYVAPRTPTEERVAELFSQLLHVERVGATDNFFDLGGHSLLATQAISRIRAAFGVELPLRALFESPTVEGVARLIDAALEGRGTPTIRKQRDTLALSLPVIPLEDVAAREEARPRPVEPHGDSAQARPLSDEERQQVLVDWNATAADYPRDSTVPEVFSRVVARFPNKVAIEFGDTALTYRQLDERANQLAWHLRRLGVSTGSRVAVALERSLELIVTLVAILKAGGAYVPLDPSYPRERLAAMLEDSRPLALVTTGALLPRLPAESVSTVVLEALSLEGLPTHAPPLSALPDSLAYIDFTSGSTGRPKGVAIPQAAVLRTLFGVDYAHLGPDETFLHIAPISFDPSTFEIWGPLLHGARLVIFPPHAPSDVQELGEVITGRGVTTLLITAGLFSQLVEHNLPSMRGLRQVLSGGDVVSAPHVRRVLEELRIPFTDCYGPTEVTFVTSCHRITDASTLGASVPIGRPIGNTQVYVLDAQGQPVPPGVVGELFAGGDGLARGYVEQPALTAERFVPNPFSSVPGARLYRTGDLARWRADGILEFAGRADAQVKVRGYRIELAEVQAALLAFPGVREAIVVAREDRPGDKRLVGYVVAPESLDLAALRADLKQRLPEYMVPSAVGRLDALPLTETGKVDRKALPAPSSFQSQSTSRPPRTECERELAALWARILQVDAPGAEDDFFELGGNSLSATQVISRVRKHFRVELSFADFFSRPTIEALARRIEELSVDRPASLQPLLRPRTGSGHPPLSFAQQRLWFFSKLEPDGATYNLPFAVRLEGTLDVAALARTLRDLLQRHEALRTTLQEHDHQPVQVVADRPALPAGWLDLEALPEAERDAALQRLIEHESQQSFNLETGPLWRVLLVRRSEQQHVLLLTLHHVIADGWSLGVLTHELSTLYTAHVEGRPASLEPLPVQYPDFAVWQRAWLRDEVLDTELGWWREQLQGAPKALELPTDRPRPATQSFRGAAHSFHFPRELSEALEALCRQEGTTPSMVVLAAFQALLSRYSGQDDISVGTPIAGRTHAELEGLIGFFVNTLVLRTKLDGDPSFRALLARVRDVMLGAHAHQDVPFEKLVETLRPERAPGRPPLFQVMLAYQNAPMPELMGPGLKMGGMKVESRSAKFDLILAISDRGHGLRGQLEYSTDLFDAATAARMVRHLRVLLEVALAAPDRPLSSLSVLTSEEQHLLFHAWREPSAASVGDASLHRLFRAQARLTPDAVAAELEGQTLTWGELYQRARQMYRSLLVRGLVELSEPPPLVPVPHTDALPLSFAQQRLWLLDQLEPGSPAYNMPLALRVSGVLDTEALRLSLEALVHRHESLRTTFREEPSGPVQVISPPAALPLDVVELSHLPEGSRQAEVRRLTSAEALRPFDLASGPLLRASLLRLGAQEHVLLVTMHHIVSDGWSLGVLVRELVSFYEAFSSGQSPQLPPLPIQYADFASWQRDWLQGAVLDSQVDYWKQQLSGAPALLELPTDRPRPAVQSQRGALLPVHLPLPLSEALSAFCQREGATPFMALLAVWQLLLARYSGQDDVSVGSPIAGRTRGETEGLIGVFLNTLVLRTQVRPQATFRELLAQVRATTLAAYEHQHLPFEKLVEELQPQRSLSYSPLFQVMLVLQNTPSAALSLPGLSFLSLEREAEATKFDLTLSLAQTPRGLSGTLSYRTDLFDASTVSRMVEHLRTLLEAAVSSPDTRVGDLLLLSASERQQVLETFNASPAPFATPAHLHALFEAQAAHHPERPAVACEGQVLTYGELDARANQLAWHLRSLGVGPETCVALCLERSVDTVVALLGIWKAGGAYVPLDPAQPALRLQALVDEVSAPVVVTSSAQAAAFESCQARQVVLDTDAGLLASQPMDAPPCGVSPENVAYVLFTSGSTGRPKGVAVSHGQLAHYVHSATERLGLKDCESFALVSTFVADLGNTVLFPSLCTGGLLHVLTHERASSPAAVAEYFQRHAVDCMKLVPSHLAALMTAAEPRHVLPRKKLVLGGESSSWALMEQVRALAPDCEVFNHYGPTETTVGVLAGRVEWPTKGSSPATVLLGRPLSHTHMYVLDERLQPVPVGVPGELFIGGAQVTRGYLRRPELTAERYLPDLFSPTPGARMYRSGDKVRWLADGRVEFIGRADFQVKVRGFRVEPGEIATVLREHPAVREALVVAREDVPGDKRLVAYVVPSSEPVPAESLRAFLQQRLPAHMVPSAFVSLEALPLTPNGKVDRKALPAPEAPSSPEDAYVAPRTPTEELLASLWAALLRVEKVSVEDDFFALGGHSLLATQVISRIRSTFGVELPLRALFEAPTLAGLAARIDSARESAHGLVAPAIVPVPRTGPLPLSFAQQRLWFIDQLEPGGSSYSIPRFIRMQGSLDVAALRLSFEELVRRHEALRTTFTQQDGQPLQLIASHAELPLPVVDLSAMEPEAAREELQRRLREDTLRPFDLAGGPLVRAGLWKLGPVEHVLSLNLHHIVSDGWSTGVLVREVAALYNAFVQGGPSPLPPLPIQYADYAVWQRQWLQGAVLEAQLAWWKQQLAGLTVLQLPTDKPRPPVQTFRGAQVPVRLPLQVSEAVKALCRKEGLTPFMLLLASWQALLARYCNQRDVSIGSPIAGRQRGETEGLIGFFVNTLVLRSHVDGTLSFRQLLQQVKETALGAYAHQDVPFERLVEELRPERDRSRAPLFQVLFTLQNAPASSLALPGLSLRPVEVDISAIKFELELGLTATAQGFSGSLGYNTDLFDADTARRLAEHFRMLTEALVARPDAALASAPLLTPAERQQVLMDFQGRSEAYPRDVCLHTLIEDQARRTPDAEAVRFEDQALTYAQLDERASRLAAYLRHLGAGRESLVGVCLERSLDLMVALLGILKSGAAYVPLDPAYPRERLAGMLEDCAAPVLLTHRHLLGVLPAHASRTVCLDEDWASLAPPASALPASPATPDALAYVIFTSGSTGRPKGAMNAHGSIVNRLLWGQQEYGLTPADTVLQKTPFSFDVSVWELFWPLMAGARLVFARPGGHQDPAYLVKLLAEQRITTVHFVPSMLQAFLEEPGLERLTHLRRLLCSGEALPAQLARRAHQRLPSTQVHNLYGPTEAAVEVTYYACPRDELARGVPIGRPVANTRILLLDASGQPVPVGVPGELYIGGIQVARGYWRRPELTAERFLPDAFSSEPGARLYRTGDVARWRMDGTVEYLGRADFQVKVRGLRIELGEIESALRQQPQVLDAVVVVREDRPGDKRLVAYVVAREANGVDVAALRLALKEKLPEYMVPTALVVLPALPLNPSGKVDRKALPAPDVSAARAEYVAPRTPLEEQLAQVFAEVLNLERVGIEDDFFALGGHSLLAVRLLALIRERTGLVLPLSALFQGATVERLAALARQLQEPGPRTPNLVRLDTGTSRRRPLFLIHGGGGALLSHAELARHLGNARPIQGIFAPGLNGGELPPASMEALARLYVEQVREVQPHGPYLLAGWSLGGLVAYEMARQLEALGEQVGLLALIDSHAPSGRAEPVPPPLARVATFARMVGLPLQDLPALDVEHLSGLEGAELMERVMEGLRNLPAVGALEPSQAGRLFAVHERLTAAHFGYVPGGLYTGAAEFLRASVPPALPRAADGGWPAWVSGGVRVSEVPGDHTTLMQPPNVSTLAEKLNELLRALEPGDS